MGSILTPLLFILYINDIPESLSSPAEMFADDMLIYNYCPPSQTSITAQESLDKVTDWCGSWLLGTNADKCESMKFTRARTPSPCNYTINSKLLTQVPTHKHLGVVLSSDLSWKPHVLSVVARSNRLLGLLKRTFGSHSGYKAMIRPILEYACQAWNPHQAVKQVKLCKPFCPTDIFKYSFWHRNIDTWNSLPSSVVELDSMNAFKKVLKSTLFY